MEKKNENPSRPMMKRVQKEVIKVLKSIENGSLRNIQVHFPEDNMYQFYFIAIGPEGTPYSGAFFEFKISLPDIYPIEKPSGTFLTTDSGRVRFNPNLYKNGMICISIFGTWAGDPWTAVQNIETIIVQLHGLLSEKPLQNEPSYDAETGDREINYRNVVQYHSIKHALLDNLEKTIRPEFQEYIRDHFVKNYSDYTKRVDQLIKDFPDGTVITPCMHNNAITTDYTKQKKRMVKLYKLFTEK